MEGKGHVVILTHRFWSHLGSDPHVVGHTMQMNGEPYTVVGVLGPGVFDRDPSGVEVPLVLKPEQMNHDFRYLLAIGRLKPGVTIQQAQADMDGVAAHLAAAYPKSNQGWGVFVEPFHNAFMSTERRQTLWLLFGRGRFHPVDRLRERSQPAACARRGPAEGTGDTQRAGRLAENHLSAGNHQGLLLSFAGGLLGVGVGYGMLRWLLAIMPDGTVPEEANLQLNIPDSAVHRGGYSRRGSAVWQRAGLVCFAHRSGGILKEGGRSGTSAGRHRLRQGLVIGEFALALALLTGAGLTIHSFLNLLRVDLGTRTDHILTFSLTVPDSRPKEPEKIISYYRQMLERIQGVPGVESATAMTGIPLLWSGFDMPFTIAGKPAASDPSQRPFTAFGMVTPDYFRTFGIRMTQGRAFTPQDTATSIKVAVVSEELARKAFAGVNPLEQRILVEQLIPGTTKFGPPVAWQVVGVYQTVRHWNMRKQEPEMLVPFWQIPWPSANIGVRTAGDPSAMVRSVANAVHSVDPEIAVGKPRSMEEVHDLVLAADRFTLILFVSFAVVALLLAGLGIYGVMSFLWRNDRTRSPCGWLWALTDAVWWRWWFGKAWPWRALVWLWGWWAVFL